MLKNAEEFKNKTILISGAGSGIGLATAKLFFQEGANLVLVGRNHNKLQKVKSDLEEAFFTNQKTNLEIPKIFLHASDLSQSENIDQLYTKYLEELELKNIYVNGFVNNAASEGAIGSIEKLTLKDYDEVFNINVRSLWYSMQKQIQYLMKNKMTGTIVNLSSIAGFKAITESSLYVASKHAVLGITKTVALEHIKNGIRINAVSPGPVETPMLNRIIAENKFQFENSLPMKRSATPEEIGEAILWLSSNKSSYMVGSSFVVDGGLTI